MSIFTTSEINGHESQYCTVNEIADKLEEVNNFTTLHVNIRSKHANFCGLQEMTSECKIKPDVIALSETKLKVS